MRVFVFLRVGGISYSENEQEPFLSHFTDRVCVCVYICVHACTCVLKWMCMMLVSTVLILCSLCVCV